MAVYTPLEKETVAALLAGYPVGGLIDLEAIPVGAENTNYFVTTTAGEYVLTLYESADKDEIPSFRGVMSFLAQQGLPVPRPLANRTGAYVVGVAGKPATLVERLTGASAMDPTAVQCAALGRFLGRLHRVGRGYSGSRTNPRGRSWRRASADRLLPELPGEEAALLRQELRYQERQPGTALPRGLIHADLFRDNVLFDGDRISGVVDFYYACTDSLLLDIAIAANDWCTDVDGTWMAPRIAALFDGYQQERALSWPEIEAWPLMVRTAALRFWLSRLLDRHFPARDNPAYRKDPGEYRILLQRRIEDGADLAGFLV